MDRLKGKVKSSMARLKTATGKATEVLSPHSLRRPSSSNSPNSAPTSAPVSVRRGSRRKEPGPKESAREESSRAKARFADSPRASHLAGQPGFHTFTPERFRFAGSMPTTVLQWLQALPARDPQGRFPARILAPLILRGTEMVAETRARWDGVLTEPQAWALFVYSAELFDDRDPEVHWEHQLYSAFNAACRNYGQIRDPSRVILEEWERFRPFAHHFDLAIRSLPTVSRVLFRGMGYKGESSNYPLGLRGSWGGCTSSSTNFQQAARFISRTRGVVAPSGSFFMILSDQARSIAHLSLYPEEEEHLHPLDLELEVCSAIPTSILQMLSLNISIVTFKRVGATLSLDLCIQALKGLGFVYDDFLASFIPPLVKVDPCARDAYPLDESVERFLKNPNRRLLVIASKPGMGKTTCALWLSRSVEWLGRTWFFISLPAVENPFGPNALSDHVRRLFGFQASDEAFKRVQRLPLVLVLDSLDEVKPPQTAPKGSWWDLNCFGDWNVKLVVTCREDNLRNYSQWTSGFVSFLYLQGFGDRQIEEYVRKRVQVQAAEKIIPTASNATLRTPPASPSYFLVKVTRRVMDNIAKSPIKNAFQVPFKLSMGVHLLIADSSHTFNRESDLYEAWLDDWFRTHQEEEQGPQSLTSVWSEAEKLAWELHSQGVSYALVGSRGKFAWFRRCPLRIHDYHPNSRFSFSHKSLQEYLVARYLIQQLDSRAVASELEAPGLANDFPVLRFFYGIFTSRQAQNAVAMSAVTETLFGFVLASQDRLLDPSRDRKTLLRSTNAISLLNAARVSFQGRDLSRVRVPHANLQCADLGRCTLKRADLRGADLKGALLDFADLSGADLTDVETGQSLRKLDGHEGAVTSVAFSEDSSLVLSGSTDTTVRVWQPVTGTLVHILRGHTAKVQCVAISADSIFAASGSDDRTVRLWNPEAGSLLHTIGPLEAAVVSVSIGGSGRVVAAAVDCFVRCFAPKLGDQMHCLEGHQAKVTCVAVASEGEILASGSVDQTVCLWNWFNGQLQRRLTGHGDRVTCLGLNRQGGKMVTGSKDTTIRVWRTFNGELLRTMVGHSCALSSIALSGDGNLCVTGSDDKLLRTWRTATGELLHSLEGHAYAVNSVAVGGDGYLVASGSNDHTVRIWRSSTGGLLHDLPGHTDKVTGVALSADGRVIASSGDDRTLCLWASANGKLIRSFQEEEAVVTSVALKGDGTRVLAGYSDMKARLWEVPTGNSLCELRHHKDRVTSVAMSADGERMVTGCLDTLVRSWDGAGRLQHAMEGHQHPVSGVAVTRDGTIIASSSFDRTVRLWQAATGQPLKVFTEHQSSVRCIAMDARGNTLASGAQGGTVLVWNRTTGAVLQTLTIGTELVTTLSLSSDGSVLATGLGTDGVQIWDVATGRLVNTLVGHTGMVRAVALSVDGQSLVSGAYDKTVRSWTLPRGAGTGTCRVLRHAGERSLQFFAHSCVLSKDTKLSENLADQLMQLGAIRK